MKQTFKSYKSGYLMDYASNERLDFGTCFAVAFSALLNKKLEEVLNLK
jgi:hypothetical protein